MFSIPSQLMERPPCLCACKSENQQKRISEHPEDSCFTLGPISFTTSSVDFSEVWCSGSQNLLIKACNDLDVSYLHATLDSFTMYLDACHKIPFRE